MRRAAVSVIICIMITLIYNPLKIKAYLNNDVKVKDAVVFVKNGHIIYKSLKDGYQKDIGEGQEPSISPNGEYIAFIRTERYIKEVRKNIKVEVNLQNLYMVNKNNFSIVKRLTDNTPLKDIDEAKWLKSITESKEEQILSFSGRFCYRSPYWSENSRIIFVRRLDFLNNNNTGLIEIKI